MLTSSIVVEVTVSRAGTTSCQPATTMPAAKNTIAYHPKDSPLTTIQTPIATNSTEIANSPDHLRRDARKVRTAPRPWIGL